MLHELYSINDENLALRRGFIRLTDDDVAVLRRLAPWADDVADVLAREFYDHQFSFSMTREFFERYAAAHGRSVEDVRAALERAQAGYFRDIFREAREGGRFGTDYFERRLHIGKLHNAIDLPLKWYLGSYVGYFDLVRQHLRRRFRQRPALRARAERALVAVFNLDMQAIVEAFYYDTFATVGVDLAQVEVDRAAEDLSDRGQRLKATVLDTLTAVARATTELRDAAQQMASISGEAGRATAEIAAAVTEVAQGAERQVQIVEEARRVSEEMVSATRSGAESAKETADAAAQAGAVASEGAAAAEEASEAMAAVRDASVQAMAAIRALDAKSEEIGGIVATITGIAEQTNLLALNAAIEAARAGEQGHGFAVVADEVRKLAEESRRAAGSIAGLIGEIQAETAAVVAVVEAGAARTAEGAQTVERAGESFARIAGAVEDMDRRVTHISGVIEQIATNFGRVQSAISEVASVAEETSASSEQVSASTEETSASTEQIASSAQALWQTAGELEELVKRLDIRADGAAAS